MTQEKTRLVFWLREHVTPKWQGTAPDILRTKQARTGTVRTRSLPSSNQRTVKTRAVSILLPKLPPPDEIHNRLHLGARRRQRIAFVFRQPQQGSQWSEAFTIDFSEQLESFPDCWCSLVLYGKEITLRKQMSGYDLPSFKIGNEKPPPKRKPRHWMLP